MAPRGAAQRPQLKRPQDETPEKLPEEKKPKKQVKGPRAVGLLQLNSSGKGTLLPIAIQVEGKFYDASVYKAEPIPMALESGTVYEVEQAGSSQGLFMVNGALHSKAVGTQPWMGAGSYLPNGTEAAKTTRKAEDKPVGIEISDSDAPPRLTRNGSKGAPSPGTAPASDSTGGKDTSDKPVASAPPASTQPSDKPSITPPTQDPPKTAAPPASDKPAEKDQTADKAAEKSDKPTPGTDKAGEASPSSPGANPTPSAEKSGDQPSGTYYRPTLRRGKPTEAAPAVDELTPKPIKAETPAAATAASNGPLQLLPAISDAGGPSPRPYKFFWKTGEEEERRGQMLALAADEIRAYAAAVAKNSISAKPAATKAPPGAKAPAVARKPAAKTVPPVFENTQFQAFDVWGTNQPLLIMSTEAHLPPDKGATTAPETYSITLVARTDIYGNLRKVYSGVTDRFHLDVTPRLQLIDAVDADGDGRGELLFKKTSDAGNGYVIYRATADKLWKLFDSLGE
jgi:hypothetical protein